MAATSRRRGFIAFSLTAILAILACNVSVSGSNPTSAPAATPALDSTKAALELQATAQSLQLTQVAIDSPPTAEPPTQPAPAATLPPPTPDIEAKIKSAQVLVYENTDERGIGMWVSDALDGMGLKYTNTGSYSGHFMEYLNSGVKYDLIIVDAEDKDIISGDFWDQVYTRLIRDKAALIAEVWYLESESNGPISKILQGCGVRYRIDMPTDSSIYWWVPDSPVFNQPNTVLPLLHYNTYWGDHAGDKLVVSGGDAVMLAGLSSRASSGEGVIASCFKGRVIIQTFSDHDYHQADIISLWQNYIHYTLMNHFLATQ